ncbi:hypothetical protein IQ277_21860 [Nostocales cyanobacterium LEGE 12452]|nr:hypothetical protein [Nostocales cyanobacterium LEGE 12452]
MSSQALIQLESTYINWSLSEAIARVKDCLHKTCKINAKLDKQNDSQVQRLEPSPTRAELATEVNKTEAQLTQIQKLGQLVRFGEFVR